jgi:hypothetical protein
MQRGFAGVNLKTSLQVILLSHLALQGHSAMHEYRWQRRTRVGRVVVELALLHPLEAKGLSAQCRVRQEFRLELADGDRHLPKKGR